MPHGPRASEKAMTWQCLAEDARSRADWRGVREFVEEMGRVFESVEWKREVDLLWRSKSYEEEVVRDLETRVGPSRVINEDLRRAVWDRYRMCPYL